MSDKKVIFVGGTEYSGSTFFDMILGNDPHGFSCGEVYALFHPFRPHHAQPLCGCDDPACDIWPGARVRGEKAVYAYLFERFPACTFIVDSSKSPFWIYQQGRRLAAAGVDVRHILIWKTPDEIASSFRKRGRESAWLRSWVNYHRLYFRLIRGFRAISYRALVRLPRALEAACEYAGLPCTDGKQEYWQRTHHTLFGNRSATVHTREQPGHKDVPPADPFAAMKHRTIYYNTPESGTVLPAGAEPEVDAIWACLEGCDVRGAGPAEDARGAMERLAFGNMATAVRQLKYSLHAARARRRS